MKKLIMGCGIVLIVCGLALALIGGSVQKSSKPREVKQAIVVNGETVSMESMGYIYNEEKHESAGDLKGLGIGICVVGGIGVLASCAVKEEYNGY